MRIQSSDHIAGQPALTIRKLMQHGREYGPGTSGNSLSFIAEVVGIDLSTAKLLFQELCEQGFIEPTGLHPGGNGGENNWYTTIKGNALANASASKPISRQTADRLLEEFLSRVRQVNDGDYAYRVKQVIVFGSYLSDAELLGDVDLSLVLDDRYHDATARKAGHDARIKAAQEAGRHFKDYMAMLFWPRQEVLLFLKHRSHALSLHEESREQVLSKQLSRIVFDADVSAPMT